MIDFPAIESLSGRTNELAALLEKWANINSGSGNKPGLDRMRAAISEAFGKLKGAQVEEISLDSGLTPALRIRMRPEAPRQILLSGHYDTVYGDDPFQPCTWIDRQTLRGPGVADMKGGLVVMLAALQAFEATSRSDALGWEALLTPDEETGSLGSAPLLMEAAKRHDVALVFEPARGNGDLVRSRKGTGRFTVTCHGRAAHAARAPAEGRNAIVALSEFLVAASRVPSELPGVLLNVGRNFGGSEAINVVPEFAQAELDLRVSTASDQAKVVQRLNELAAPINGREGLRLEISGSFNRPPKECLPEEEVLFAAWQGIARELKIAPFSWSHSGGGSDGNILSAAGLANLDGVGVVGDHYHSEREFCLIPSLTERAQLAALFLTLVDRGKISFPLRGAHP